MIAILGATGYVGRSLARYWANDGASPLVLFARNLASLAAQGWPAHVSFRHIDDFGAEAFDLVINAIGAGDPARVRAMGTSILDVTQAWDKRILATMGERGRYVFLSSGAIYGGVFERAVEEGAMLSLPVNRLGEVLPYVVAKLYAEARHRYARDRRILDIRVFGFADACIPLSGSFFLSDLARCVARREPLVTSPDDMIRDYAGARELATLVAAWEASGAPNRALDVYTLAPVGKRELLDLAAQRYGLQIRYEDGGRRSPTGDKFVYASTFHGAAALGYAPQRAALDIVRETLDAVWRP
jgi:nucleoside-diphosphate-sugar epimerase